MVTRPVMASMPKITRLNWRKVVLEIRGAMGCKSARISVMGFLGCCYCRKTITLPQKPYFICLILAKVETRKVFNCSAIFRDHPDIDQKR